MEKRKFKRAGIVYTPDQENALEEMINWSHSSKNFYTLEGAAGTGKTTVLKEFIKSNKYKGSSVVVTAPTHKAARIISKTTNLNGVTIQKLLGLRPNLNIEEFDINNPKFDPRARKAIQDYYVVVIDESSMINRDLFTLIQREAMSHNVKVLFVGDPYQLPPVREKISPVFTSVKDTSFLTEIVRQSEDNPLLQLLDVIRDDVKHNTFNFIKFVHKHPNGFNKEGHGYVIANKKQFGGYIVKAFASDDYSKDIEYAKYCAYTNDNILAWNSFVRSSMYHNDAANIILKDDLITAYSTLLDEFLSQVIVNSEDYIIDDIQDYRNQSNIEGYVVRFRKVFGGQYTPYMFIVDSSKENNVLKFLGIANNLILEAKNAPGSRRSQAWENYYTFKDNHLLIRSLYDDRGKLLIKKDLDYGYCLTVHKTQGSTYKHVFVNARNIIYNRYNRPYADHTLRNKLLYVAISRATDTATLFM